MSMEKHTPGPWSFKIARWHTSSPIAGFIINGGKKDIVSLNVNTKSLPTSPETIELLGDMAEETLSYEECEANADLIARAPGLLAENKALKEQLEGNGWISVEDKPLVTIVKNNKKGISWIANIDTSVEFVAAVPYNDSTRPGESLWWTRLCVIEENGMEVLSDEDNTYCGWDVTDVTHYILLKDLIKGLPSPPTK